MPDQRLEYRVFLSSPTGLEREGDIVRAEIQEYNHLLADSDHPIVKLVSWNQIPPGVGRPQARINEEIVRSDYLFLVLRDRWGSSTGEGGYTSGSLEELALAIDCLMNPDLPMRDIAIFFQKVNPNQLADPGSQLSQVLRFKKALTDSHELLYKFCGSRADYRRDVRSLLSEWARGSKYSKVSKTLPVIREWIESERHGGSEKIPPTAPRVWIPSRIDDSVERSPVQTSLGERGPTALTSPRGTSGTPFSKENRKRSRVRSTIRQLLPATVAAALLLIAVLSRQPPAVEEPSLVTMVELSSSALRGGDPIQVVDITPTRGVVLVPAFFDVPSFDSYRFELLQGERTVAAWIGIPPNQLDQLRISFPRSSLPAGKVSARLYGERRGYKHLIQESYFEVRYR